MSAAYLSNREGLSHSHGISIVVPVYRSEDSLCELVTRLHLVLTKTGEPFELILVNDGSPDGSLKVMRSLARQHPWIMPIDLMRNYGQHNALLCGIRAARFDVIVTMDDDLQHPPEEIPKLLEKLGEGSDVVYGTPRQKQHGVFRNLASVVTKIVLGSSMGINIARQVSAFRAFRSEVANSFLHYNGAFVSLDVLLTWGTNHFAAVEVEHQPRKHGVSGYSLRHLIRHTMNMMTGFSTLPLQVASVVGFLFVFFGLGVLTYVLVRYLIQGTPVPGFPFLASIVALFSGAQLFTLGIMGEYLARIHFRSMQKPPYMVRPEAIKDQTSADGKP